MKYKYPLQKYPWSFLDRLKIASFVLNPSNRLTMGQKVKQYEKCFEDFYGGLFDGLRAVAVTSGSQANDLLFQTWIEAKNINIQDATFFANCTTWSSNLSPILIRGGKIELIDINRHDLSMDYGKLESSLKKSKSPIKVIWVTALIGFSPNMDKLQSLARKYGCELFGDLCESSFSKWRGKYLVEYFDMSTTSSFLAHFTSSIEGGMLFISQPHPYPTIAHTYHTVAQLCRSHGLTRCLPQSNTTKIKAEKDNPDIDPEFLFQHVGTNQRLSEIHALYGILDFKRVPKYLKNRKYLWDYFLQNLSDSYYKDFSEKVCPFCIPIISDELNVKDIKEALNEHGWETRPIICDMSAAPAYKFLAGRKKYLNSGWLSSNGCYTGLSNNLKIQDVDQLLDILNNVKLPL